MTTHEAMIEAMARILVEVRGEHPEGSQVRFVDGEMHSVTFIEIARHDARALQPYLTELKQEIRREALEEALRVVAEQRCERSTPWDHALVTAMGALRALSKHPVPAEETK